MTSRTTDVPREEPDPGSQAKRPPGHDRHLDLPQIGRASAGDAKRPGHRLPRASGRLAAGGDPRHRRQPRRVRRHDRRPGSPYPGPATDQTTPTIRYVHEAEPGIVAARNRALDEASGDVLVFIDDDEIALPGWPNGLLETSAEDRCGTGGGPGGDRVHPAPGAMGSRHRLLRHPTPPRWGIADVAQHLQRGDRSAEGSTGRAAIRPPLPPWRRRRRSPDWRPARACRCDGAPRRRSRNTSSPNGRRWLGGDTVTGSRPMPGSGPTSISTRRWPTGRRSWPEPHRG